ncbi:hypothetical protein [Pseudobutyrivibrio sp.]|uniref:hypothetical protein n=1 Tax=Pseudobutyrivibrio sp. TaxID=2014367 RepID=UPI001E089EC9|nr:hypothetical protein [Pseudobutyrivibrio sp.]MBE5910463.1 hypothetical protein [Pseudobutyrivibrio sp.]
MPVINPNEKKVNVWTIPEFQAAFVAKLIGEMVRGELPDNVSERLLPPEYGNDSEKITEVLSATNQFNPENGFAFGLDPGVKGNKVTVSDEEFKAVNKHLDDVRKAALNQASKRGDKRIKQYYEDAAYLLDPTEGNITESLYTSPYINSLMAQRMSLTIPTDYSSDEQKRGLTQPLYDAIYDFNHAVRGEVAADYTRQKYEKEGWNKEKEGKYLAQLHNSHARLLYQFNILSKFRDDPQNNTAHYTQDTLSSTFGTDESGRTVTHAIGMLRGEKKAIENGWGKDELFILGMLGGIEEAMKTKSAVNHSEKFKDSYPQFKADFTRLKNECFYSTVSTPAEKLAIADKIKNFLDTQKSVAADSCISMMNDVRAKFDQVYNNIAAGIEKIGPEYANVNPNKNGDTAEYLKGLFDAGMESGTYSIFVREYIDTIVKGANGPNPAEASTVMSNVIRAVGDENEGAITDFRKQALISYFDLTLACASEEEQLAEDIRTGKREVDKNILPFETAYKDEAFSREYAKFLLLNSDLNQKRRAAEEICKDISAQIGKTNDLEQQKNRYIKNNTEGLDERQISAILKKALPDFSKTNELLYTVTNNIKINPQVFVYNDEKFAENYNKANADWHKYGVKQIELGERTSNFRERAMNLASYKPTAIYDKENKRYHRQDNPNAVIDPKSANSQTFMNLLNAMDKVEKLNASYTPNQVLEAYRNLRDAAKAYNKKIDSHTFAGRRENGKQRRILSGEVYDFAKDAIRQLEEMSDSIEMNVPMSKYDEQLTNSAWEAKVAFRPEVLKRLEKEKNNCLGRRFDYDNSHNFDYNKKKMISGMAELLTIRTLTNTANDNYGTVFAPSQITHDLISKKRNLLSKDIVFKEMANSFLNETQVKNMMQKMKDNPGSVYEEYNKFTPEYKASMAAFEKSKAKNNPNKQKENNNIIQNAPL